MKSITIHGIDTSLDKKINEKAAEIGMSKNCTVKHILTNSLLKDKKSMRREAFSDLFGKWTQAEKEEFNKNVSDFGKIDTNI